MSILANVLLFPFNFIWASVCGMAPPILNMVIFEWHLLSRHVEKCLLPPDR